MKYQKTTLLLAIMLTSAFLVPTIASVNAQTGGSGYQFSFDEDTDPETIAQMPAGMANTLAGVFSGMSMLGPSGAALGQVFALLFENIVNMQRIETNEIDGVFVLNASYEDDTYSWSEDYGTNGRTERHWLYQSAYQSVFGTGESPGYIEVTRTGTIEYEYHAGAHVVFILWDEDKSLINAINQIYEAYWNVMQALESLPEDPELWTEEQAENLMLQIVGEILSAVTYMLFHINDIITGNELFITNVITWENWSIDASDYDVDVTGYKYTSSGKVEWTPAELSDVGVRAANINDQYVEYLLSDDGTGTDEKSWATFSFNLVELWLKNFEIHINTTAIAEILSGAMESMEGGESPEDPNVGIAQVFQGLDIELYLITHSLLAFTAFDDVNADNVPSVTTAEVTEDDVEYEVITDSEVEYWFALQNFASSSFDVDVGVDVYDTDGTTFLGKGVSWEFEMEDVEMIAVPVGLTPADLSSPPTQTTEYISMGFTFCPYKQAEITTDEYGLEVTNDVVEMTGAAVIKLDQGFGEWNSGAGWSGDLSGLDFAVLFVSTMLHFHVEVSVEAVNQDLGLAGAQGQQGLVNESNYNVEGEIHVGDAGDEAPLAAIDIAGPQYEQGPSATKHDAATTMIPVAYLGFNIGASTTYIDEENPNASFHAEGFLEVNLAVVIYAVAYPTFNGSGDELVHDPTFSIFMTWENPGFWAVVLVIGSVTLVAVAAIMITKKKNRA